jgi:hypothetical protein
MINKLHSMGLLPDDDVFYIHHADLQSRNLLFTTPTPTTVQLTDIVDWDNALFAPKFMGARAPFFLWTEDDALEDEESDVLLEPADPEMQAYKRIFEEMVGANFCEDSYRPKYIFARRMRGFMVYAIRSGSAFYLAGKLLDE